MTLDSSPAAMLALGRAFARHRALCPDVLDDVVRSTYDYALRLASLTHLRTRNGELFSLETTLAPFREKLASLILGIAVQKPRYVNQARPDTAYTVAWEGQWHRQGILQAYPQLAHELRLCLHQLYQNFPALDEFVLQDWLMHKKLVLVLGGGGGTGFAHLPLLQGLEEAGIQPSLIVGTSIGSIVGYLRAIQDPYDAARSTLSLPSLWQISRGISPSYGASRHGLPGLIRFDFSQVLETSSRLLGLSKLPNFNELKIPFACVASGILRREELVSAVENKPKSFLGGLWQMTQLTWRKASQQASHMARQLLEFQAVEKLVFGLDPLTRSMTVIDAVAFSSLVPAVLNYELPHHHYRSREVIEEIFRQRKFYRLCDGGLASNVPVEVARDAAFDLNLAPANAYFLAQDVFAPQSSDGFFYPLQQMANSNALRDAQYSDAFIRQKTLISPINLAPSLRQLRELNARFKKGFAQEMQILRYALRPLRPLATLDLLNF